MAVAIFQEFYPPSMGSDRRIFELTKRLNSFLRYYIITPPLRLFLNMKDVHLIKYYIKYFRIIKTIKDKHEHVYYLSLPTLIFRISQKNIYLAYLLALFLLQIKLLGLLTKIKPRVVIVAHPSPLCGLIGISFGRILKCKIILDYPDAWSAYMVEIAKSHMKKFKHSIYYMLMILEKFLVKFGCDVATTVTDSLRRFIIKTFKLNKKKIIVIPNGICLDLFNFDKLISKREIIRKKLGIENTFTIITYIGRLEDWSIPDEILFKLKEFCEKHPNIFLLIIGDGLKRKKIKKEIANLIKANRARILNPVPHNKVPEILIASDIALLPFKCTLMTNVSFPIKVLEYVSMGLYVISSNLIEVRKLAKFFRGMIFFYKHEEEFKEILLKIIRICKKRILPNRNILALFDWNILSNKLKNIIRDLLSS